jgi:hypothetical protein
MPVFLKRFKSRELTEKNKLNKFEKNDDFVDSPLKNLDLSFGDNSGDNMYDCFAVIEHFGSMDNGHYIAKCRSKDGRWQRFDDAHVSALDEACVCTSKVFFLLLRNSLASFISLTTYPPRRTSFCTVSANLCHLLLHHSPLNLLARTSLVSISPITAWHPVSRSVYLLRISYVTKHCR